MEGPSGPQGWPLVLIGLITIVYGIYTIATRKVRPGPPPPHQTPIVQGPHAVRYGYGYIIAGIVMLLIGLSM